MDQMKEDLIKISLLSSALSIFTNEPVLQVHESEEDADDYVFLTYDGNGDPKEGHVEHNFMGNYNVWLEGKLSYEVEGELFELLAEKKKGLIGFYKKLKKLDYKNLKEKSRIFVDIVMDQAENLINMPGVGLEYSKKIKLGNNFIFSDRIGNKFVININ